MNAPWQRFADELARWRDAGRVAEFWWRDDDASQLSSPLARLLGLSERFRVPLALAVIPLGSSAGLFEALGATVDVIQHGTDHHNRAAAEAKKTEFPPSEPVAAAVARLAAARQVLEIAAAARFVPVLAPPWNRLPESLAKGLAGAGFRGVSQFGARRAASPAPGVSRVNTHVDLIAWRGGRGFAGEEGALSAALAHLMAKREGRADPAEATGWLTHHAVHDEATWVFLERLFETTLGIAGIRWMGAQALFHIS